MPTIAFFQKAGLFAVPGFLDAEFRAGLLREVAATKQREATIVTAEGKEYVDEAVRRVRLSHVSAETLDKVTQRIESVMPRVAEHYGLKLDGCERSRVLVYREGDFFVPHVDNTNTPEVRRRRISVVVFLTGESEQRGEDTYGEGHLRLYGLLPGAFWDKCPLPVNGEPGLLVAFRSGMVHEVTPVSHGKRVTIVTWFLGPEPEAVAAPQ